VTLPRWSRKVMLLNISLMLPLVLLGGYILWQTTHLIFWLYLSIWLGILTVGRYYICHRCPYYGQDCPTYGWGHLARVFPKDDTRGFNTRGAMIDYAIIVTSLLLPVVAWLLSFFDVVADFGTVEHVLIGIYLVLAIAVALVHDVTGCGKCELEECPMSKAAKEKKKAVR
jgi:hypothetical protein